MPAARPVAATGSVFLDARADGHALRVTWHAEAGVVVLSVWKDNVCTATIRLLPDQVAGLIEALAPPDRVVLPRTRSAASAVARPG